MCGQEAVVSALGARTHGRTTVLSDGTKNIIRAMEHHGVRRFVCESSLGVGNSKGQLGLLFDLIVLPLWLRYVYRDKEVQEQDIRQDVRLGDRPAGTPHQRSAYRSLPSRTDV